MRLAARNLIWLLTPLFCLTVRAEETNLTDLIEDSGRLIQQIETNLVIREHVIAESMLAQKVTNSSALPDFSGGGSDYWSFSASSSGMTASCTGLTANQPKVDGTDVVGTSKGDCEVKNLSAGAKIKWRVNTMLLKKTNGSLQLMNSDYDYEDSSSWSFSGLDAEKHCSNGAWVTGVFVGVKDENNPQEDFGLTGAPQGGYWAVGNNSSGHTQLSCAPVAKVLLLHAPAIALKDDMRALYPSVVKTTATAKGIPDG